MEYCHYCEGYVIDPCDNTEEVWGCNCYQEFLDYMEEFDDESDGYEDDWHEDD